MLAWCLRSPTFLWLIRLNCILLRANNRSRRRNELVWRWLCGDTKKIDFYIPREHFWRTRSINISGRRLCVAAQRKSISTHRMRLQKQRHETKSNHCQFSRVFICDRGDSLEPNARISDAGNFCRFSIKTRPEVKPESTFGNLLKCEILTANPMPRKLFTMS